MSLTIDSSLGELFAEPDGDQEMLVRIQETAIGHSLNESTPLRDVCTHAGFITRPSYILYINDRIEANNV